VHNEHGNGPDQSNLRQRSPSGRQSWATQRKRIGKYELAGLKTDSVIDFVDSALFLGPCPAQAAWAGADDETGRIISARKATTHERTAYEEGDF
jgi:hypothetical protein